MKGKAHTVLDHVALLVRSIETALERIAPWGLEPGPVEEFPGEGTRECYLGDANQRGRLLLMQPLGEEGPYARALRKRGPGLHHVALRVPDLDAFLSSVTGWLLLPHSVTSIPQGTAWLARPGVGTLLEVAQNAEPLGATAVEQVQVPGLLPEQELEGLTRSPDDVAWLTVGGGRRSVAELVAT